MSSDTAACLSCHRMVTPGIVGDWENSRHAKTTPADALKLPKIERRMSAADVPADLQNKAIGCGRMSYDKPRQAPGRQL